MKILSTLVLVCAAICVSAQSNYLTTGKGAGNWNDPSTWQLAPGSAADADGHGIPDANDNVTVLTGHTVVVKQNAQCTNLTIEAENDLAEIVVDDNGNLSIADKLTINSKQKESEVYVSVRGALSAGSATVNSYGRDISVDVSIAPDASFMVAAQNVKSLQDLTRK